MDFVKMHGLGNSYILFNLLESTDEMGDFSYLSKKVSDVNFGIGSDGILLICPSKIADFKMRIFNIDGSEGKNCGNGLRCVAKYLFDHLYTTSPRFTIETLGGVVRVEVEIDEHELVEFVTVDMGEPQWIKMSIPMIGDPFLPAIAEPFSIGDEEFEMTCVSMGNPHAILFVDNVDDVPLEKIGPEIEYSPLFPERVNVGIVEIQNQREFKYRVWERGSGLTMACGTGACAAVVAATLTNRIEKHQQTTVHLPGGDLTISWDQQNHVWKRGAAAYICTGKLQMEGDLPRSRAI
ncbi:diaminopimelate epimerase [Oikeobacillus pervagus]|uniref:Diaminopimelate epimerase n=1 Tax=Oikeobacillus pervagus TaxID=1325931 RepID=A0AAJ1WK44_9BACI|nr:diaminopimelate epimerase [Oikeobacillus pervagus]MDQ0216123.1 diaminopimelate epimerase [Oikeobacillus pervagus]